MPHATLLLNNSIDEGVELAEGSALLLELLESTGIGVHIAAFAEELTAEAILGVDEDAVLVAVLSGRGILAEKGNLPAKVAVLSTLAGSAFLGLLVDLLAAFLKVTLNLDNVEHNTVGATLERALVVEEILKGSLSETGVLLVDLREDNSVSRHILGELLLILSPGVTALARDGLSELGASREGQDVRVGRKSENVLGGGISNSRADVDNLTGTDSGELELESKDVPWMSAAIGNAEFPGVGIHLVDGEHLGDKVEVLVVLSNGLHADVLVLGDTIAAAEVGTNPLAEGRDESALVLLEGSALARIAGGGEVSGVGAEESPGSTPVGGNVELALAVVHTEGRAMETDDLTNLGDNGQLLEFVAVDDNSGEIVIASFAALGVEGGVNDLERADVLVAGLLVGEGSINNDTVDGVESLVREGNLSEFLVLVLLGGSGLGSGFLSGFGSHFLLC